MHKTINMWTRFVDKTKWTLKNTIYIFFFKSNKTFQIKNNKTFFFILFCFMSATTTIILITIIIK